MTGRNHIGYDPIEWVNRLKDVNESSQFSAEQKAAIAAGLTIILEELARRADGEEGLSDD